MVCRECLLSGHMSAPLHTVEVRFVDLLYHHVLIQRNQTWDPAGFWRKSPLCAIGLTVSLGHSGSACPYPTPPSSMVVFHTNGLHSVNVRFCGCGADITGTQRYIQLLRMNWHPATQSQPATAFTTEVLDLFHALTVQGKLSAHDYYQGIMRLQDGTGTQSRVVRIWLPINYMQSVLTTC